MTFAAVAQTAYLLFADVVDHTYSIARDAIKNIWFRQNNKAIARQEDALNSQYYTINSTTYVRENFNKFVNQNSEHVSQALQILYPELDVDGIRRETANQLTSAYKLAAYETARMNRAAAGFARIGTFVIAPALLVADIVFHKTPVQLIVPGSFLLAGMALGNYLAKKADQNAIKAENLISQLGTEEGFREDAPAIYNVYPTAQRKINRLIATVAVRAAPAPNP